MPNQTTSACVERRCCPAPVFGPPRAVFLCHVLTHTVCCSLPPGQPSSQAAEADARRHLLGDETSDDDNERDDGGSDRDGRHPGAVHPAPSASDGPSADVDATGGTTADDDDGGGADESKHGDADGDDPDDADPAADPDASGEDAGPRKPYTWRVAAGKIDDVRRVFETTQYIYFAVRHYFPRTDVGDFVFAWWRHVAPFFFCLALLRVPCAVCRVPCAVCRVPCAVSNQNVKWGCQAVMDHKTRAECLDFASSCFVGVFKIMLKQHGLKPPDMANCATAVRCAAEYSMYLALEEDKFDCLPVLELLLHPRHALFTGVKLEDGTVTSHTAETHEWLVQEVLGTLLPRLVERLEADPWVGCAKAAQILPALSSIAQRAKSDVYTPANVQDHARLCIDRLVALPDAAIKTESTALLKHFLAVLPRAFPTKSEEPDRLRLRVFLHCLLCQSLPLRIFGLDQISAMCTQSAVRTGFVVLCCVPSSAAGFPKTDAKKPHTHTHACADFHGRVVWCVLSCLVLSCLMLCCLGLVSCSAAPKPAL